MSTVLITGGTGLIGNRLSVLLEKKGYQVRWLSRTENLSAQYPTFGWNIQKDYVNPAVFRPIDHVIHLAGAGIIDKRWSAKRKEVIINSRVQSTQLLAKYLKKENIKLKSFVGGSAVGYYGNTGETVNTIGAKAGEDFMAEVCEKWENSYDAIRALGIRTPIVRTGVVLSTQGGALAKMLPSYKLYIGSYFGKGDQYYSWIHIDDLCNILIHAMENNTMDGIYNGAAPEPTTSKILAQKIATALGKKALLLPVPKWLMNIVMGEMSAALFNSTRAVPEDLLANNFSFEHPDLVAALKDLFQNKI